SVADNPASPKKDVKTVKIEPLTTPALLRTGESHTFRFKVLDAKSSVPKTDVRDMTVLVFLAPGVWQQRELAKVSPDGVYEMSFVPPQPGVYYLFFESPSLGLQFNQSTPLTLQVVKP